MSELAKTLQRELVRHVEELPDSVPMALFPLRLETRFKGGELWVRAYPDDVLVESFQPDLSETELRNARAYWCDYWAARGNPAGRKAAWRGFVRRHGAGRAKWITETYVPAHPHEEPAEREGEHVLVIAPEDPVPEAERKRIAEYWSEVWTSGGARREQAFEELRGHLGEERAEEVVEKLVPGNLRDESVAPDPSLKVEVIFLEFTLRGDQTVTAAGWTRAARTRLLPERLVLMGFEGERETLLAVGNRIPSELQVGPDPSAEKSGQIHAEGEEVEIPEALRWTVDFEEAVRVGMGFVAKLDKRQARRGFDRLLALGVRLSSDPDEGATQLEELIAGHQRSRKGLSLLAQGTPTNNTDEGPSGYSWWEDPEASYRHFFEIDHEAPENDPDDPRLRRDGAWLAGMLGIDRQVLKASPGYFGTDQAEARAMNVALWPATLGYFMEQMMAPVFSDETIARTRDYFNRYVLGRDTAPALRIGQQAYGVLPATVWTRLGWFRSREYAKHARAGGLPPPGYLAQLHELVEKGVGLWESMAEDVASLAEEGGDPQGRLLDVVGLHPTSVEFHQRYAESFEQLYNRLRFSAFGLSVPAERIARRLVEAGFATLRDLGWTPDGGGYPPLLDKFFLSRPGMLHGDLVDALLSETEKLSVDRADDKNYLAWLQTAAEASHDTLRRQEGFAHGPPTALLYLMVHHALDLGYVETSLNLYRAAGLLDDDDYRVARQEPKFIHVDGKASESGSRWERLYRAEPRITGGKDLPLGDFIPSVIETAGPYLGEQLKALEVLKTASGAALERAFVEHLDCCSYRLDAWRSGLVGCQLSFMRGEADGALTRRGVLIGAYGWLEDLRPRRGKPEPVRLDGDLAEDFQAAGAPLVHDPANNGYVHAPSADHAVAAAVLRNGYLANASADNPDAFSVNLTSERVRTALATIEGIRNGQPLGALLGYQLERGLHDVPDLFLDRIVYPLRQRFPLAGNQMESTRAEGEPITALEARNVVDGLAFAEYLDDTEATTYPYGLTGLPSLDDLTDTTTMSAAEIGRTIDATVDRMRGVNDAVADLAMAEGVYQAVRGNYDRLAATLDAFGKGEFPPLPEVAETPRSGRTLTHRVALHLEGGLDPDDAANRCPRAKGEPALNRWLAGRMPPMSEIFAAVGYRDSSGARAPLEVSMADLGLEPIDLLYLVDAGGEREMPGLDDLLIHHAARDGTAPPRDDAVFTLLYRPDAVAGFTLFEVAPLVRGLRGVVLGSRELRPSDLMLANKAGAEYDAAAVARPEKATTVVGALEAEAAALLALAGTLESELGPEVDRAAAEAAAVANLDSWAREYADALRRISPFGLRAASLTTAYEGLRPVFDELRETLAALVARWEEKPASFEAAIAEYEALPSEASDEERYAKLIEAGRAVSTTVVAPLPPLAEMETTVRGFGEDFEEALDDLRSLLAGGERLGAFFAAASAFAPRVGAYDQVPLDLDRFGAAILSIADELRRRTGQAVADVEARVAKAEEVLKTVAEAPAARQGERVAEATRAVLGEEFVVLPEFRLSARRRAEWDSAWTARGGLLAHLETGPEATPFPLDDWLHGVARVRGKIGHLERAALLGEALSVADEVELQPLQFPFRAGDAWLGLRFPETMPDGTPFTVDGDRLLYTADLAPGAEIDPADPDRLYCGILVDEWSELVPAERENTGLAFHFDRPSAEAPQAILLAVPPELTGAWKWRDLVDTLGETLDFARLRAVEPAQIDGTGLGRFLPALISAVTLYPITAMLNFAENNAFSTHVAEVLDE